MPDRSQERQEQQERETKQKENEELANFEQRANWWREHYGDVEPDDAAKRMREAAEQADQMPSE